MAGVVSRGPVKRITKTTTARMPVELHDALIAYTERTDLTVNWVINHAVRQYLDKEESP